MTDSNQPDDKFSKSVGMLKLLTSVGCGGAVLGLMIDMTLEAHQRPKMPAELRRYVTGPIVVHSNHGNDLHDHPLHQFKDEIMWERAQIGLGVSPFMVSPTELAMVIHEASFVHPLRNYLAEIYLWAGSHAIAARSEQDKEHFWDMLNGGKETPPGHRSPVITDEMVLTQEPWKSEYLELSRQVRNKVINHVRGREREARVPDREEQTLFAAD